MFAKRNFKRIWERGYANGSHYSMANTQTHFDLKQTVPSSLDPTLSYPEGYNHCQPTPRKTSFWHDQVAIPGLPKCPVNSNNYRTAKKLRTLPFLIGCREEYTFDQFGLSPTLHKLNQRQILCPDKWRRERSSCRSISLDIERKLCLIKEKHNLDNFTWNAIKTLYNMRLHSIFIS